MEPLAGAWPAAQAWYMSSPAAAADWLAADGSLAAPHQAASEADSLPDATDEELLGFGVAEPPESGEDSEGEDPWNPSTPSGMVAVTWTEYQDAEPMYYDSQEADDLDEHGFNQAPIETVYTMYVHARLRGVSSFDLRQVTERLRFV